jgi:hypothetical protein
MRAGPGGRLAAVAMKEGLGVLMMRATARRDARPWRMPANSSAPAFRRGCRRRASVHPSSPGSRGVASSPATGTDRGGADAGTVARAKRGVSTHENPFRWSRGEAINTSNVPQPRRRARHLFGLWLESRDAVASSRPRRCARPRRRPVSPSASRVRTIERKSYRSGLNSSPIRGREGVRFGAVSARFGLFRAVLYRFGPELRGRKHGIGSEATPGDFKCDPHGLKYLLGEASDWHRATPPAPRGVFGGQLVACEQHPRRPVCVAGHPPAEPAAQGCCRGGYSRTAGAVDAAGASGVRHACGSRRVEVWSRSPGVSPGMGRTGSRWDRWSAAMDACRGPPRAVRDGRSPRVTVPPIPSAALQCGKRAGGLGSRWGRREWSCVP